MESNEIVNEMRRRAEARGELTNERPADAMEGKLRDGDSADIGENKDARAVGYNTNEKYHASRADEHPNAQAAQDVVQDVFDDGGYIAPTDEGTGHYGRKLVEFRNKYGVDIAPDMVMSGAAAASRGAESTQAEMTGIARRALGYESSSNAEMNAVGEQNREMNDDFAPWEKGTLTSDVYDRRGTFEKAFDRGTSDTKAALGGALNFIGEAVGNDQWAAEGSLIAKKHGIDSALNKRKYETYEKVEGFEQAVDYVVETLGELAPGLIVDALATVGTVAVGAATGGVGAVAGAGLMGAMRATAGRALAKGAKAGMYAGPALSGFAQAAGNMENRLDAIDEGEHTAEALLSGTAGAVTNALPFLAVMGKSLKASGISDAAAGPVLDALAKPSVAKRLKDIGFTAGIGAGVEGATELAQATIDEIIATEMGGDEWRLDTKLAIEAVLRGVIGGGAMGGVASATANAHGFMQDYNEAKKGVDAEGEKVDSEGWKEDTVVEVEQDEADFTGAETLEKSVERVAKLTPKKAKSGVKTDKPELEEGADLGVVGQGQFDSMTSRDVPNLKSERYDELRGVLEPKGKPLSEKEVGALIDSGVLTNDELASYAADSHYGSKTPLSGGYDKGRGDEALARVFKQVIRMSRDSKIKLTEGQKERLREAEEIGTDAALKAALADVNPELNNIVYRNANKFDGRAMFRDYTKSKADRVKTRERMKKEAVVEPEVKNAEQVFVPEGEAPKDKRKGLAKSTPDWIMEGRKPSKQEVDDAMTMLDHAKDKLKVRVRSVIEGKGKNTQAARDIFATEVAKNAKQLAEVGQYYDFESSGSLVADKMTLLNKIVDSSLGGTPAEKKAARKPKAKPTTTKGKLDYLKQELGTRTASDGDMGKLLEAEKQYAQYLKDGDAIDPNSISDASAKALGDIEKHKDNKDIYAKLQALQARIDKHEFIKAFPKAVNNMYESTAADKTQRELGARTDQQVAYTEKGEDGTERNVGDVQGIIDTIDNDLEVAAHYVRRTKAAEEAYRALRGVKGLNGAPLVRFMREKVKPTEREQMLGDRLPKRGRADKNPINNGNTTKSTQFTVGDNKPPLFTHGDQERRPDTPHLSAGVLGKIKEHLDNEDYDAVGKILERAGILPEFVSVGKEPQISPSERLAKAVRSSFPRNKRYRDARPEKGAARSDRGITVRDNETGKKLHVDMDAVTRWSMREDKLDLNDADSSNLNFINELSSAVLSGISALAELRLPDGRPMFSIDLSTIRDDSVVYRMDGDKLASVTMGTIRGNIHHKGKKYTPKKDVVRTAHVGKEHRATMRKIGIELSDRPELSQVKAAAELANKVGVISDAELASLISSVEHEINSSRTLADLVPDDIGNVYRDEVSYDEVAGLVSDAVADGRITEERGDELLTEARANVFDKDYEQAAKDGGELTMKTKREDDEIQNRDEISTARSTRSAVRKRVKSKAEDMSSAQSAVKKGLEVNVAEAKEKLAQVSKSKGIDIEADIKGAKAAVDKATTAMKVAIVEAIRRNDVEGYTVAELRNAHGAIDTASPKLLGAVAKADVAHSKKEFVNKGDFGKGTNVHAELVQAKHHADLLESVKKSVAKPEDAAAIIAKLTEEAERRVEVAERAFASYKDGKAPDGTDLSKGRKIQLNRKVMKTVQRNRGMAKKSLFRLFEMTRTRLGRIHPEAGGRADKFTALQRNATEYLASRMGKDIGDAPAIQKGYEDSIRKVDSPERSKYEAFVREINMYTKKHDPSYEPVTSKVHLDLHEVERNREGFLSILRENGIKNPERLLESILDGRGYPEFSIRPELTNQPRSGRKAIDALYDKLKEGGYVDTDAPRHLLRLINSATSWASWNETHGGMVGGKWDSNAEFNRIQSEVHTGNRQEFAKLYQGVTGRLGMGMSPKLRALNSAALAFQSATVLWFSGLASIPEVAATYARMRGDTKGMLDDAKSVLTGVGREQLFKVARDLDIITDAAIEHSLQEMYNMNDMTAGRVSQKIQATVFKLNGQNYVTKLTRAIATKAGERYLVRAAEDGAAGEKRLNELGVTSAQVREFAEKADLSSVAGKKYRDAVHKFVNEAVTNPRATQLPLVANDPRFLLVTTLKKFFYGFYDNLKNSLSAGMKDKDMAANPMRAIAVTAAVALPMALLAELMRELIRYPFGRPAWQGERDLVDWGSSVFMATGLLGPLSMAESVYKGTTYGSHPVVAAAGPTAQFAVDVATLEMQPSRVVPLVNQIPWLAKPFNDGVENMIKY